MICLVGDGKTDNSPVMDEIMRRLLRKNRCSIALEAGVYALSETFVLPTQIGLQMESGARIIALPGFKGDAIIRKEQKPTKDHYFNGRICGGVVDGTGQDLVGIHVPGACRMDICDMEILDCCRKGIHIGVPEDTWGYEVNVRSVRCALNQKTSPLPGSVGLHYERITDSYVSQVIVIGYETGVASESSSVDYSQVHVWNFREQSPLKRCFYCNGWGDSYNQCYADSPFDGDNECYGFYINRPFNRFSNCRVYCNSYCHDNTVVGFHISDSGTHGSYLNNLFTAQQGHRMKSAFSGNLEAATMVGNTYDPQVIGGKENRIPSK